MFTFTITPENRIAVEVVLLLVCSLAALFIDRPARQEAEHPAEAHDLATGD